MQAVQFNSPNKQEDDRHILPMWMSTQLNVQLHQFDCEFDSRVGYNVMFLYTYRSLFRDKKLEPPTDLINGYSGSPVKNKELPTAALLTGNQAPQKTVSQVMAQEDTSSLVVKQPTDRLHTLLKDNSTKADTQPRHMLT